MSEKLPKKIAIFSFAVLLIALLSFLEFQLLGFINQKFGELYSYIVGLNIPFILGFLVYFINKKYYKLDFFICSFSIKKSHKFLFLGVVSGSIILFLSIILLYLFYKPSIASAPTSLDSFLFVFTISIIIGAWEELFFRVFILSSLFYFKIKPIYAIIISSVIFCLAHIGSYNMNEVSYFWFIGILIMGTIFSLLYLYTKSIYTSIGMHIAWDFISFAITGSYNFKLFVIESKYTKILDNIEMVVALVFFFFYISKKNLKKTPLIQNNFLFLSFKNKSKI